MACCIDQHAIFIFLHILQNLQQLWKLTALQAGVIHHKAALLRLRRLTMVVAAQGADANAMLRAQICQFLIGEPGIYLYKKMQSGILLQNGQPVGKTAFL